jgi:hypothetical protein
MPTDQIGIRGLTAQQSCSMPENLAQERFTDGTKIDQIHRSARSFCQRRHQRQLLVGREAMTYIDCQIHITVRSFSAASQ